MFPVISIKYLPVLEEDDWIASTAGTSILAYLTVKLKLQGHNDHL